MALSAQQKGLELSCECHQDIPATLVGDEERLRQILINLIGNAIKFTVRGTVRVVAQLDSLSEREARIRFSVVDSGRGIPAEKQATIFESFSQADGSTTREVGGTGLGLAICSRLVSLMDGTIWAESEVGKGSVFHFTVRFGVPVENKIVDYAPKLTG